MILEKRSIDFELLASDTLGRLDSDNYPFVIQSMDTSQEDIVVGAHLGNVDGGLYGIPQRKKFYLAKYNNDIQMLWYREYGGDRAYWMTGLKALENNNIVVYGFVTDSTDEKRYGYIMCVDENGNFLTSTTYPLVKEDLISVVNPGGEAMWIRNPSLHEGEIALFDMQGRKWLEHRIQHEVEEVDTHHLPPGPYVYVFFIDDRPVQQGKWLKVRH